jgi:alpha-mannosidase
MAIDLLNQILPQVKSHIYAASIPLPDWKLKEGTFPNAASPRLNDTAWWKYTIPAPWGGFDKTVWFRTRVSIPPAFAGKQVALVLDLPESLLYVNGKPYQGVDQHHQEVLLTSRARAHQTYQLALEAYSGRRRDLSTFNAAHLVELNPTARALYHGLIGLRELEKIVGQSVHESKEVRELIRQTLIFLKYFKPEGEEFPNAIGRAYNFLLRTVESEYKTDIQGLVHLIAQSHIDVVWLWKLKETKRKCARTFTTVLRLMEEFPELSFVQPQALYYQFTKENYPEIYKEIRQRISEGRWHPIGSMWVESDCNLPNGESLVRQILYGKRFFRSEFGFDSDILWLPDTFGYSWSLPQIMKRSGIKYFFTTKLTWNDTTKFPHNTFWWQGLDGSKVLAHNPAVGLEGSVTPKDLKKSWDALAETEKFPHTIQTFGYGDGGGGPAKDHVEAARVLRTIVGLPPSTLSTVQNFFAAAEERSEELATWNDELYLEKHRGTYTTHGWIKRENRRAEEALYLAELLSILGTIHGRTPNSRRYNQNDLESTWKKFLVNQFHDILPGTAIADAYEDTRRDFEAIQSTCERLQQQAVGGLVKREKKRIGSFQFSVFNPLNWKRSDYVVLELKSREKAFVVTDSRGRSVEHQVVHRRNGITRLLCYLEDIPPFSFLGLDVEPGSGAQTSDGGWKISNRVIETPLYRVRLDSKGQISSIHDRASRRELVARNGRANQLQAFKDTPKQWDAWEIDPDYAGKQFDLLRLKSVKVIESGPLRGTLRLEHRSDRGSSVSQEVSFYHKSRRIDFQTRIRWKEAQTLLKVAFPFALRANAATYEIQFGAMQRSTKSSEVHQKAKYEVPAQQWADVSEQKFGVSLLNDCKYGYDAHESTLRLTLLRSPHYPHALDPLRLSDSRVTDQGEHTIGYALYPHPGDWKAGGSVHRAREFNLPLLVHTGAPESFPPLIQFSSPGILVDSIKKAEDSDDVVFRLHEGHGQATKTTIEFGPKVEQVTECDLMENELSVLKLARSKLALRFSPFEIKTLKVRFRKRK